MKTESEIWREERERIAKRRLPSWPSWKAQFPEPEPEPDHFVWHDVGELIGATVEIKPVRAIRRAA